MKKILISFLIVTILSTNIQYLNVQAASTDSKDETIEIPQDVLNSVPEEIKNMIEGKQITQEQYDLYLELVDKESNPVLPNANGEITTYASNVNPKNCTYDLGSNYCFRIDPANSSTKEPYHVHIYKKQVHYYCMRLDNLKECDKSKNQIHKFDDLPDTVKKGVMGNKKVQERVIAYNPNAPKWASNIPLIKTLAISVIVVALVVTPIPGDEYIAWAYLLRAL
ncbi:hypothetical protein [Sporosarcina aquimarina]|uniref:Uncharacterized protein n=1 Tax=Sporosarcina aquimarina TaxID=114975 RepID=A0ABU4FXH8_9BACL|nr:hypothetical protein [Sporosarcina aquimarina]MDW0109409.1 hypothetical protein [Sporosarcina aquimarina]